MTHTEILHEGTRILEVERKAVADSIGKMDARFVRAVELLQHAKRVYVTGIGKSGLVGKKIAATLTSVGTSAYFMHPVEALHGDVAAIQQGDAVIVLSKSGNTVELLTLIPHLKKRLASIIGILGNPDSEIAKSIDVTLDASVDEEACPYDLAPSASTTVAMAIGDALALTTMKVKQFTPEHFAESHPLGQLGRNLTLRVSDVMKSNDAIPVVTADKTFYDSLIVMTEKQLGCVCIVNEKNELIGIITDGDVRRILQTTMNLHEVVVSQVMTKNPIVVEQTMLVGKALEIMEKRNTQISVLPVVHPEDKSVVGIVRIHDLLHIH